jgi:hypothetical protein
VIDILNNLVVSSQVRNSLLIDGCSIVMTVWNEQINSNNEFRVYVLDGEVKAITQQKLTGPIDLGALTSNIIISEIENIWNTIKHRVEFIDCVFDVSVVPGNTIIIEINSGNCWSTAGSSLFHWREIVESPKPILRLWQ